MIRRALDWLANAKSVNDEVNADALRIASLEAANADLKAQTRAANIKAMVWQVKAEELQDKLDEAARLISFALKRKASIARYNAKRGRE